MVVLYGWVRVEGVLLLIARVSTRVCAPSSYALPLAVPFWKNEWMNKIRIHRCHTLLSHKSLWDTNTSFRNKKDRSFSKAVLSALDDGYFRCLRGVVRTKDRVISRELSSLTRAEGS